MSTPDMYYSEWWNINTHRCNHLNKLAVHHENYGFGRAIIGDWGRIGAVSVTENDDVDINGQIILDLLNKLRYHYKPKPLLPPYYQSVLEEKKAIAECDGEFTKCEDSLNTVRDYGYTPYLNDPILGEQASAAFLCGKVQGLLRGCNLSALTSDDNIKSKTFTDLVDKLLDNASKGISTSQSQSDQITFLREIHNILFNLNNEYLCQEPSVSKRLSNISKLSSNGSQKSILPITLSKLIDPPHTLSHLPNTLSESHLLSSFDPLLIRLASRPINSQYTGSGLLCEVFEPQTLSALQHNLSHLDSMVLWSVPQSLNTSLHLATRFNLLENYGKFLTIPFENTRLSGRSFVELNACYHRWSNKLHVVGRLLPNQSSKRNVVFLSIELDDDGDDGENIGSNTKFNKLPKNIDLNFIKLANPASSICMNKWFGSEWSVSGNRTDNSGNREIYVQTFDQKNRVWSGFIKTESNIYNQFQTEHDLILTSLGNSDLKQDLVQTDLNMYINQIKSQFTKYYHNFQNYFHHDWLSLGNASFCNELILASPRRVLLLDTRQTGSKCGSELFNLNRVFSNFDEFNANDMITFSSKEFIGDVYHFVGCQYSMCLLDKRMPNRSVLHWSHNLNQSPCFCHWVPLPESSDNVAPDLLISATSQFPSDLIHFGLNLNTNKGVQLVGPSLSSPPLSDILDSDFYSKDLRCLDTNANNHKLRFENSTCGLLSFCIPSSKQASDFGQQFHTWVLTSRGDLFDHIYDINVYSDDNINGNHFGENDLTQVKEKEHLSNWLAELLSKPLNSSKHVSLFRQACTATLNMSSLSNVPCPPRTDHDQYWSSNIFNLDSNVNSSSKLSNQHLLGDLNAIWRMNSEESRGCFYGSLTDKRLEEEGKHQEFIRDFPAQIECDLKFFDVKKLLIQRLTEAKVCQSYN